MNPRPVDETRLIKEAEDKLKEVQDLIKQKSTTQPVIDELEDCSLEKKEIISKIREKYGNLGEYETELIETREKEKQVRTRDVIFLGVGGKAELSSLSSERRKAVRE
ncbi:MAG: hypothetical protein Q9222_002973 [Ikaeria aurantiellina]